MAATSASPDGLQGWRQATAPRRDGQSSRSTALEKPRAAHEQPALPPDLPLEAPPGRIIIHLDLDAFYVGASRLRDADLVGKPVGIKQKGLLATVSYEARALGCAKLGRVTESIERCPALILVDGEDLSFFRATSRKVFSLVSNALGPTTPVEKLGMDELWMDVTALIDGHLNAWPAPDADGWRWFSLPGSAPKADELGTTPSTGFRYAATAATGHVDSALPSMRFVIASYLAAHLRALLEAEMSLSASAGIAPNKALAKLAGASHKPAQQTLFAPSDPRDHAAYVANRRLRSLGGFGSSVVERITEALAASRSSVAPGEQHQADAPAGSLTAKEVRERIDQVAFIHAFGAAGTRLWAALWGQDSTPVVHAPEFPSTISIEDTYAPTGAPATALGSLTAALMRRLDVELRGKESKAPRFVRTDRPAWGEGGGPLVRCYEQVDDGEVGPWMRWPAGLRLSTMSGGWGSRVSRQTAMPVELFDETLTREARHASLLRALEGLQRLMCKPGAPVRLLNIAAFDLRTAPPERGIGSWLAAAEARTAQRQSIDMDFLLSLPADIREEIAAQHGVDLGSARRVQQVACPVCDVLTPPYLLHDHALWPATGAPEADAEDGEADLDDAEQDEWAQCPLPSCGIPLPARLADEHRRWHEARGSTTPEHAWSERVPLM